MELSREPFALGDLIGKPVCDGSGRRLGRAFEVSRSVRAERNHRVMWQVTVLCSGCAEESEVVVENLDDVEREACECGYSFVMLAVASFEPVCGEGGELVELTRRGDLPLAA